MSNELEEKKCIALMQKHLGLLEPWNINVNIELLSPLKELAVQVLLRSIYQGAPLLQGLFNHKKVARGSRTGMIHKDEYQAFAVLPINEHCGWAIECKQEITTEVEQEKMSIKDSAWSIDVDVIDFKTMQKTMGLHIQTYARSGSQSNFGNLEYEWTQKQTVSSNSSMSKLNVVWMDEVQKNLPISESSAFELMGVLQKHFNADLLKGAQEYATRIKEDPKDVQKMVKVVQMGFNGQIVLSAKELLEWIQSMGVIPSVKGKQGYQEDDSGEGSSFTRRRLNLT